MSQTDQANANEGTQAQIPRDEVERLWQYKMHEEDIFYQRNNFFLVAESMLLIALADLFGARAGLLLTFVLAVLGCLLTLVWIYASSRQLVVMRQIAKESEGVFELYHRIRVERSKWPLSSTKLLAYFVPSIVMGTWITVIIIIYFKRTS